MLISLTVGCGTAPPPVAKEEPATSQTHIDPTPQSANETSAAMNQPQDETVVVAVATPEGESPMPDNAVGKDPDATDPTTPEQPESPSEKKTAPLELPPGTFRAFPHLV